MLILRRKAGESLVIGDDIRIAVLDINEGSVRLAIDAPKKIPILRSELLQAVDVNRDAANEQSSPQALIRLLKKRPRPTPVSDAADAADNVQSNTAADASDAQSNTAAQSNDDAQSNTAADAQSNDDDTSSPAQT